MIRLIPITRAHHVEEVEIGRVNQKLEQIRNTGLQVDWINSIFGSVNWVLLMLFNLCTLIFIAYLYQKGFLRIGVGDIVLLTGYFSSITTMVMAAMNCVPAITKGLESVRSIGEVLECPDIELNGGQAAGHRGQGRFRLRTCQLLLPGQRQTCARGHQSACAAGRNHCAGGLLRRRKVDHGAPRDRFRAAVERPAAARRTGHEQSRSAQLPEIHLRRNAGDAAVRRHDPRKHLLRHSSRRNSSL